MAKIIRLTESDLNRIVKRILKEQNEEKINPPLEVPIEVGNIRETVKVISKEHVGNGCIFKGVRPSGETGKAFFSCGDEKLFLDYPPSGIQIKIPSRSKEELSQRCMCNPKYKSLPPQKISPKGGKPYSSDEILKSLERHNPIDNTRIPY